MDGNFKVRCVDNREIPLYTTGEIYEFRDGIVFNDAGLSYSARSFEEWVASSCAKWELVDESDNKRVGGFIHCKICKRRFGLKKEIRYTAVRAESIFPIKSVLYDAFDCPHCGCQNIVGIRESEVKINE